MAYDTVILQGRFTQAATAVPVTLNLRSDVDWIEVYNLTVAAAAGAGAGAQFYWQRGMTQGLGLVYNKTAVTNALTIGQVAANAGFFLVDTSLQVPGAAIAETGITNAVQPVVTTANTGALATGSVVRLNSDSNLPNLMGFDFEVDTVIANTSFRMRWALANAPGAAGAGDGFYRAIAFDPIFYPRRRFIVNISQAAQAVVTLSVAHGYTVGQEVSFVVPPEFGMVEMDGLRGTIVAISTAANTITVNIDSTAFSAFVFPAVADVPFNWAQTVPFGEDTGFALSVGADILADATRNTAILGITLMPGVSSPAGVAGDVIYWKAGKSFSVDNL